MREHDLAFVDVVKSTDEREVGLGLMIAVTGGLDVHEAGTHRQVLSYLAERAWVELEREEGRTLEEPELTDEIIENARALDEELATGRCET